MEQVDCLFWLVLLGLQVEDLFQVGCWGRFVADLVHVEGVSRILGVSLYGLRGLVGVLVGRGCAGLVGWVCRCWIWNTGKKC